MKRIALLSLLFVLPLFVAAKPWSVERVSKTPASALDTCSRNGQAKFLGAKKCKKCHFKQWASWRKTVMAKAFETLKPGKAVDAKKKYNLDPAKDYTKDPKCLECHTTGYGKPGGYPAVVPGKPWTSEEIIRAKRFEGVQCEDCHGPGSLAVPYKDKHPDFKLAKLMELGLHLPDKTSCQRCHNEKSPTLTKDSKLDFEKAIKDKKKIHKHSKLKHPH